MAHIQQTKPIVGDVSLGPFRFTTGAVLDHVSLRYERMGPVDAPVILVCHALTGNHRTVGTKDQPGWWSSFAGTGKYIDTEHCQILTFNVLGGCDGSTGPASRHPESQRPYRADFPRITVRDMVHAQYKALKKLGITKVKAVIGGSLGGMQVLEWGLLYPDMMEKLVVQAATPVFSDYGIAFNHIARTAIEQDPGWNDGYYETGKHLRGLELARMVGMVTYRSAALFAERFDRGKTRGGFDVSSYLDYQGEKLAGRFDANSYLYLLKAMDLHDIGEGRGGWQKACKRLHQPLLAISYGNDLIYEADAIKKLAAYCPNSTYYHVETPFAHDGFLTEFAKWGPLVQEFLAQTDHIK